MPDGERELFCRGNKPCKAKSNNIVTYNDEIDIQLKNDDNIIKFDFFDENNDFIYPLNYSFNFDQFYKGNSLAFPSRSTFTLSVDKNLSNLKIIEKVFHHHSKDYVFKLKQENFNNIKKSLPSNIYQALNQYFSFLLKTKQINIFHTQLNTFSCSNQKIKYLIRGSKPKIKSILINKTFITEFDILNNKIPDFLKNLIISARKSEAEISQSCEKNELRHDYLENEIILNNSNILAVELPVYDESLLLLGHIDFLMVSVSKNKIIFYIIDYKPDVDIGKSFNFLTHIPQVCFYAFLLRKRLNFPDVEFRCVLFNSECGWIFDPSICRIEIPNIIKDFYDPQQFLSFKSIFGTINDYLRIDWSTLINMYSLHHSSNRDLFTAVAQEFSKILELSNVSFSDIYVNINELLLNLRNNESDSVILEHIDFLISVIEILKVLDDKSAKQSYLFSFFRNFRLYSKLWKNSLTSNNRDNLFKLHQIHRLCYIWSRFLIEGIFSRDTDYERILILCYLDSHIFSNDNYFNSLKITFLSKVNIDVFKKFKDHFLKLGYLSFIEKNVIDNRRLYEFTDSGLSFVKTIMFNWQEKYTHQFNQWFLSLKEQNNIFNYWSEKSIIINKYFNQKNDKKYLIVALYLNKKENLEFFNLGNFSLILNIHNKTVKIYLDKLVSSELLGCDENEGNKINYFLTDKGITEANNLPSLEDLLENKEFNKFLYDQINNNFDFYIKYLILAKEIIKNKYSDKFTASDFFDNSKFTMDQIYYALSYLVEYEYLSIIKENVTNFYSFTKKGYLKIQGSSENNSVIIKDKVINKSLLSDYKLFYLICINEYLTRIKKDYFLTEDIDDIAKLIFTYPSTFHNNIHFLISDGYLLKKRLKGNKNIHFYYISNAGKDRLKTLPSFEQIFISIKDHRKNFGDRVIRNSKNRDPIKQKEMKEKYYLNVYNDIKNGIIKNSLNYQVFNYLYQNSSINLKDLKIRFKDKNYNSVSRIYQYWKITIKNLE